MRAVVVYESCFGNTERVAEAIASGLRGACDVSLLRAADATPDAVLGADVLVLGAPTQVHGLPGPKTRRGASAKYGVAVEVETAPGIRELVDGIAGPHATVAAAFDTRFRGPAWLMGAASKAIVRRLRRHGYDVVAPPESFVLGPRKTRGPLAEGELDRAFAWGADIARRAAVRWHALGVA